MHSKTHEKALPKTLAFAPFFPCMFLKHCRKSKTSALLPQVNHRRRLRGTRSAPPPKTHQKSSIAATSLAVFRWWGINARLDKELFTVCFGASWSFFADVQVRARKVLEIPTFLLIWLNNRMRSVCRSVGWRADACAVANAFVLIYPFLKVII